METTTITTQRKVTIIPAKQTIAGVNRPDLRPKRVAAYCRVSTDKDEQEHSFETQKQMYTEMIMMKPTWQMAGIFADEGITERKLELTLSIAFVVYITLRTALP